MEKRKKKRPDQEQEPILISIINFNDSAISIDGSNAAECNDDSAVAQGHSTASDNPMDSAVAQDYSNASRDPEDSNFDQSVKTKKD
ncbi:hypothetical protein DFO69_2299 [Bacillus subtilis]|nr:hypothetical protein DFO69_2299 [Bacillus subtilis]